MMAPVLGSMPSTWEIWMQTLAPRLSQGQPLGSDLVDGSAHSPHTAFKKINKNR